MNEKRKILILEDAQPRIDVFKKKFKNDDVYFFDNVSEAIEAVELLGPFDIFFLDHDLDGMIYVESDSENTGYQFAKYLAYKKIEGQIIIHSMNLVGAKNMKSLLTQAEVVPFPKLVKII
jgi:CheY-like chemotaxis protein